MSSISTIALSGLNAASRRLDVSASNIANVRSSGALPAADGTTPSGTQQAYKPLQVVQTDVAGGGTQTSVTTGRTSSVTTYDPEASFANRDGLTASPNVDLSQELINLTLARYSFAANAKVLKADDEMQQTLIDTMA
jgi:flagellar basal-body rod protein FlgC